MSWAAVDQRGKVTNHVRPIGIASIANAVGDDGGYVVACELNNARPTITAVTARQARLPRANPQMTTAKQERQLQRDHHEPPRRGVLSHKPNLHGPDRKRHRC